MPTLTNGAGLAGFLDEQFRRPEDLSKAPSLRSQLSTDCARLDGELRRLIRSLSLAASHWISRSGQARRIVYHHLQPTMEEAEDFDDDGRFMRVELPSLSRHVGRIDALRVYAETTLQLEALVGDLEDATFFTLNQASGNHVSFNTKASNQTNSKLRDEKLSVAIKAMKDIETVLVNLAKRRPNWTRLLMAVDSRVEKALAILRPQALSDHRVLLASLGWPPSLSKSTLENDKILEIPNPLILMQGEKKEKYSQSFLTICALQHLQAQRATRQHDLLRCQKGYRLSESTDMGKKPCIEYGLWAIDELVHPIAAKMEYHFGWWSNEPKFIFALVYKISRDFLDGVDNILQPLIDKAMLAGCSAKEAWVGAMVKVMSKYLERKVFPTLVSSYDDNKESIEANSSWLHLIDLMITFDKRMQVLATSGTPLIGLFAEFDGFRQSLSVLSIFHEHSNWLQTWAEIELRDAEDKLSSELEDERSWLISNKQHAEFLGEEEAESFLLSTREDYKAPLIADSAVRVSWVMIDRARSLPSLPMRVQFIKSSATMFLNRFFFILLERYQDVDFMAAITEDDALLRIVASVNTARYCESVLQEWCEDVSFLEMNPSDEHSSNSFFEGEIMLLVKLGTDCLEEITSALLLEFDALCWNYIQNIKQGEGVQVESRGEILEEGNLRVSPGFIEALDMLRDRMRILRLNLNSKDFLDLWRSIATGLDHFIFISIPMSDEKFSCLGFDQFKADVRALFLTFRPYSIRPESFFPCINESLKLLTMGQKDADHLIQVLTDGGDRSEECLRLRGLFHLSVGQVVKLLVSVWIQH